MPQLILRKRAFNFMLYNLNEEYIAKCFKLKNIQTDQWKQSKFWRITINDLFIYSRNQCRSPEWYCHAREHDFCCWLWHTHTLSWNQQTGKTSSVSQRYCLGRFNCSDGVQTQTSFAGKIFKAIETQDRYCSRYSWRLSLYRWITHWNFQTFNEHTFNLILLKTENHVY